MWWLVGSVLAFLLALGGIIALARPATARWERERRAAAGSSGATRLRTRLHTLQRRAQRHP